MTHALTAGLAGGASGGRAVLVLEGGYNLTSVARSAEACVRVLQGEGPLELPGDHDPSLLLESADEAILTTAAYHLGAWPALRQVWGSSLDRYAAQIRAAAERAAARREAISTAF